jgi:hypothetical protein
LSGVPAAPGAEPFWRRTAVGGAANRLYLILTLLDGVMAIQHRHTIGEIWRAAGNQTEVSGDVFG